MAVHFRLHQGTNGDWYLTLVDDANGQSLLTSEGYVTKWNARRAAKKFPDVPVVEDGLRDD